VRAPTDATRRRRARALIILDLISDYRFEGGAKVLRAARGIAATVAQLKARARAARIPVIYVNDTAGRWESNLSLYLERCLGSDAAGADVVRTLKPTAQDHFLFKPKHSGFYATALAELLQSLNVTDLILTGVTSHQCVLFTAMDAYVRDFHLIVPVDGIAAPTRIQTRHAFFVLRESLRAQTPHAASIRFN
jgi:nicotinamidase-related amidase